MVYIGPTVPSRCQIVQRKYRRMARLRKGLASFSEASSGSWVRDCHLVVSSLPPSCHPRSLTLPLMPLATLRSSVWTELPSTMGLNAIFVSPYIRLRWTFKSLIPRFVVGKVEYMSAGGSVKDRIAKAMVEAAEKEGKLIPGKSVVIEPTSGNTGTRVCISRA